MLRSSGFSHEWFPRQKTPSTEWEARIDFLMDANLKTLDFKERKETLRRSASDHGRADADDTDRGDECLLSGAQQRRVTFGPIVHHHNRLIWNIEELYFKK